MATPLNQQKKNGLNNLKRNNMKTEKKKAGRPRKPAPADAVIMKLQSEIDLEHAERAIAAKNESIEYLENKLDEAYREQEDMLKELDRNIHRIKYHCEQVRLNTGEITQEDIAYCLNLMDRIMKHKFECKSE